MTTEPRPAAPPPTLPPPQRPPARRGGLRFIGRMLAALLVIAITTGVTLALGAALLWNAGFTPRSAAALADAQQRVATLEVERALMQTQVTDLSRAATTNGERLDDLARLREEVRAELADAGVTSATLVAGVRADRDAVQQFATAEAGRATTLNELSARSERIERFLRRLSDIAEDTALDLGEATPTPALPLTATPDALPLVTPTTTIIPTPAVSATASATAATGTTRTPLATPTVSTLTATATP